MSTPRRIQSALPQQIRDNAPRILYMEDDPGLARLVQKRLERIGYVVHIARDGGEGLAKAISGDYELLLVDQNMPVHDGLEVIRSLVARDALPPTIMITGAGSEMIAVEALKLGARDYLVKDVDGGYLDLLPTVIAHVLTQKRLLEEKQRAEAQRDASLVALQASEAKNRAILDAIPDVMLRFSQDGTCLEAMPGKQSPSIALLDDMPGRQLSELLPAEVAQLQHQYMQQALRTGQTQIYEYRLQVKHEWRNYEARLVRSGPGEVLTILRDITQQVRMHEQLKSSNARLATLQHINAVIHSGLPLSRVLRLVVENIRQRLGYPGVLICLPDQARTELIIRAAAGELDPFLERTGDTPTRRISFTFESSRNPLIAAFVEGALQEAESGPWLSALRDAGLPGATEVLEALGVAWGIALPLWHADQIDTIIGVLGILKAGQNTFSDPERELLSAIANQTALAMHGARLLQTERQGRREMEALYRSGLAITSARSSQQVLSTIVEQIVELAEVEGCAIYRWHEDSQTLAIELFLSRQGDEWQQPVTPGTLLRLSRRPALQRVLLNVSPACLQDSDEEMDTGEHAWMDREHIKSRLILPLVVRGHSIGLLELTESRWRRNFTEHDIRIAQGLAAQAAVAMENARLQQERLEGLEREMELAHRIQVSLLPPQPPPVPGLAIAARSVPARQVGGDFYRYLSLPDGRFGLVIGDVSGKGVPAALLMAMTITAIDAQLLEDVGPADLLTRLNLMLYPRLQPSRTIVGLLVALFDPRHRCLQISNAGMIDPLIVDHANRYWLEVSGLPIGALPAFDYTSREVSLSDQATLILASDGIVEAMDSNGELFGFERLEQVVEALREEDDPLRLLDGIWETVSRHVGNAEAHDDMTLTIVRLRAWGSFSLFQSGERMKDD
jgi:serine phosphatase RsbU (regulator of sigma subunit)/CheY-like chemotaxis protein